MLRWCEGLPSGKHIQKAIEHGPVEIVEIVDLASYKMVIFHSFLYVYQRVPRLLEVYEPWPGNAGDLLRAGSLVKW